MDTIMDLCFLCIKEYNNCVLADERIVSQVEYLLPEITIIKLGIPLRICSVCDGALCAFSKFKQSSVESSRRLEASIKGAQGPPLHTSSPPIVDDKMEEIFIKEEYVEETPLDTQMHTNRALLNPITLVKTISAEPHNQLHKDRMYQNIQLHTDTNTHNIEEIFIKVEQIEEAQQGREFYNNILKEECVSKMNGDTYRQPEHNTEDESTTLNTNEEDWEGSSTDSEKVTVGETDGNCTENIQIDPKNMHSGINDFQCEICDKSFANKFNLIRHMKTHSGVKDFQCKLCSKVFTQKTHLTYHMKIHSGVTDFQCEICNKSFPRNCDLIRHMKTHSGVKEFQCEICEKLFTRNRDFIRHIKKHSDVKEFRCEICAKSFTAKSNLTSHMRIHSKQKEFQCKICNKLFRFRYSLNYHMKLHSGIKEFQCEICSKSFTLKGTLISHMKSHSGIKEVR